MVKYKITDDSYKHGQVDFDYEISKVFFKGFKRITGVDNVCHSGRYNVSFRYASLFDKRVVDYCIKQYLNEYFFEIGENLEEYFPPETNKIT